MVVWRVKGENLGELNTPYKAKRFSLRLPMSFVTGAYGTEHPLPYEQEDLGNPISKLGKQRVPRPADTERILDIPITRANSGFVFAIRQGKLDQ